LHGTQYRLSRVKDYEEYSEKPLSNGRGFSSFWYILRRRKKGCQFYIKCGITSDLGREKVNQARSTKWIRCTA
jgi:hypothetical protein